MALDPVLQQLLDQLPTVPEGPIDHPAIRVQAEAMMPLIVGPTGLAEVTSVEDRVAEGPGGPVPMRVYRPSGEAVGTLHYIHGGGWSVGNLTIIDPTARRLCHDLGMVVVTSTYRLAPEDKFPAAFDDSFAASAWVLSHLSELGGEALPVVIGGDSAGGNLAAAVCIALRDSDVSRSFNLQLLLYPAVDLRQDETYESRERDADPSLRSAVLSQCYSDYLTQDDDPADPRISPLLAGSLANLPPAIIVVLTVDPLRDEAVIYAHRLRAAAVPVELIEFANLTHGFVHFAGLIPAAATATNEVLAHVRRQLHGVAA